MSNKTAFLFAGQGSQRTGMGSDFYEVFPEFKSVYDSIHLDFDIKEVCFRNPDNMLLQTQYTQPCMVAFACGVTEILRQRGIQPDFACGLSLGEYSALFSAGVWSLEDTMRIVSVRGKAMTCASEGIDASMVAITGTDEDTVDECCRKAEEYGVVSICNINCPGQIVIGGDKAAVENAVMHAKEAGAGRCVPLAVSGPFHTQYMKPAGEVLNMELQKVIFHEPCCEVLYNYLGGPKREKDIIRDLLVRQIQHTVRMRECIEYLINQNVIVFMEIGPGNTLSGFVKKTLKAMNRNPDEYKILALNSAEDLKTAMQLAG